MHENLPPGFIRCDTLPDHAFTSLVELMGQGSLDAIESIGIREHAWGLDIVLDVEWSTGTGRYRTNHERSVLFAYRPESQCPEYCLHHASISLDPDHGGDHHTEIRLPPSDSSAPPVSLTSPTPASAQKLIELSGLEVDELPDGLIIFGNHHGVIAWRGDDLLTGNDRLNLVHDAVRFLDPIVNSSSIGAEVSQSIPGTYAEELLARLRRTPTRAARLQLAELVTRDDVDRFLASNPPRRIPPSINRRILGDSLVALSCCNFVVMMSGLIVIFGVLNGMMLHWISITFMVTGLLTLLGSIFWARWRRHRLRILRRGTLLPVHVVGVEATEFAKAGNVDHLVIFESLDPSTRPLTLTTGSPAARIARGLKRRGVGTTILLHPTHPFSSHWTKGEPAIWLEGMAVDRIPD